jgi:hypothetical protein
MLKYIEIVVLKCVWIASQCVFDVTGENNQPPFVKVGRDVNERCVSLFSVN